MNTAECMVKCLEEEGVEYIFGIPGEENLAVMNALRNSSIKFITVRHEQGAAFMADVYGRLTGKAGVCLSTLGPGATNLVTGVADADGDGAPLVAITGQVGTDRMHITSHQFLDLTTMFEPITKRTKMVVRPDTVDEIVRLAFKYAEGEKPGATHIDLPVNISKMDVGDNCLPLKRQVATAEYADFGSVEEAAAEIFKAERPVILAGSSAIRANCSEALTKFVDTLHIPVINTMSAKGIVSNENPYSLWTIGIPQKDYQNYVLEKADLIICVGYDIVEFAPGKWNPNGTAQILHIDRTPAHVNKLYQPLVEVVGDITDALDRICMRVRPKAEPEWALQIRTKIVEEHLSYEKDDAFPMKPQRILQDVRKVMAPDDIVISDVGAHKMWIARHYTCMKPRTCLISNGFATMGISVPGCVSAKLINPDKKVLAICGDGGFMMNMQELETAVRIGTPFVVLLFHDDHYGLIRWKQMDQYGQSCFVDFGNPDFVMLAEAMHCKGYRVEKADDLIPMLEDAFKQNVPAIIDCRVDYGENVKLSEHLKKVCEELEKE